MPDSKRTQDACPDVSNETFVELCFDLPLERAFTYSVPETLCQQAAVGKRALAPFGKRTIAGYITGTGTKPPADGIEVKPIIDILDESPVFDPKRLEFYRWLAGYYFCPLGSVLGLINPAGTNLGSRRTLILTEKGAQMLKSATGLDEEVLGAAERKSSVTTLANRLKGRAVYSAISRLVEKGLLTEDTSIDSGVSEKTARFVLPTVPCEYDLSTLKRSPLQARILSHLAQTGERPLTELCREFPGVADVVKKLASKKLVSISERRVFRDPLSDVSPKVSDHEPNMEQKAAIGRIKEGLQSGAYSPFLLYGVTGSGKTLVYLKAIEEAVRLGKRALFLVPEISLTPWPSAYLASRFQGRVAISHSGLSPGQRADEWERIRGGKADVIVGARSALFSPIRDLGLIIVDEEHETSYKQEEGVRYNGRDCSLMLARYLGITVVLGSATPSIETFHNARNGKITELRLGSRVSDGELPAIETADMRSHKGAVLSERLKGLLLETHAKGSQSLLFLNRRGFAPSIICKDCGRRFECLNCSVTLTMHKSKKSLKCHYCDMAVPLPEQCPDCKGTNLIHPGAGTEKVEEEARALLPKAVIGRMDRDTTRKKGSAKRIIDAVEKRKVDILIGTQMVSKGHHFPSITLVGIISGDTSLALPDFRSAERTFQLMTQAAGRAGRGAEKGEVVIQTLDPDNACFKSALTHDYEGFYAQEIELRKELDYPPFSRLCCLRFEGLKEEKVARAAEAFKKTALRLIGKKTGITILGPSPALVNRVKNRYRWQLLIKGTDVKALISFLRALRQSSLSSEGMGGSVDRLSGVAITFDMDPQTIV